MRMVREIIHRERTNLNLFGRSEEMRNHVYGVFDPNRGFELLVRNQPQPPSSVWQ